MRLQLDRAGIDDGTAFAIAITQQTSGDQKSHCEERITSDDRNNSTREHCTQPDDGKPDLHQ
jgi:hypothetical protein